MPGARRSVLHACGDGRGVRARVRSPAGHRDAAAGKTNAQRPGLTAMHVVVASHYRLPVKGYGGTERVVVALVSGLAALGHRVTLLARSEEHTSELQSRFDLVCRLLLEKKKDWSARKPDPQTPKESPAISPSEYA